MCMWGPAVRTIRTRSKGEKSQCCENKTPSHCEELLWCVSWQLLSHYPQWVIWCIKLMSQSSWKPQLDPWIHVFWVETKTHTFTSGLVEIGTKGKALALCSLLSILENLLARDGHPWESENRTGPALLGSSPFLSQKGLVVHLATLPSVQHPWGLCQAWLTPHSYLPGLRSEDSASSSGWIHPSTTAVGFSALPDHGQNNSFCVHGPSYAVIPILTKKALLLHRTDTWATKKLQDG